MKKKEETMTEFINRAMMALRDGNKGSTAEHLILVRMCGVFIKKKIKMNVTQEEGVLLKSIIENEVLKK